jgi:hypothetical protein
MAGPFCRTCSDDESSTSSSISSQAFQRHQFTRAKPRPLARRVGLVVRRSIGCGGQRRLGRIVGRRV